MTTKYFVRIEGRQEGPFTLEQLPAAGVTPDTYVWAKGMADWEKASHVADICRFYRQRLAGTLPQPETEAPARPPQQLKETPLTGQDLLSQLESRMDEINRQLDEEASRFPPRVSMAVCILLTLLCFVPTGLVAIYYCWKSLSLWRNAPEGEAGSKQRLEAHDAARSCRMWQGVTFFLGIIVSAALYRYLQ